MLALDNSFPKYFLHHPVDELVDELSAVATVATLSEVSVLAVPAEAGVRELEGPQELVDLTEVGANSDDLVDDVLNAEDVVLAEVVSDDLVAGDRDALAVNLGESALEDELAHRLEVGVAVGDEGLDALQHVQGGVGEADEDTVVDLAQAHELEDLAGLGVDAVDTADADHEGKLGLRLAEEVAGLLGLAAKAHKVALCAAVLLDVLLSALEDGLASGNALLWRGT